jgi:hypothetical protein
LDHVVLLIDVDCLLVCCISTVVKNVCWLTVVYSTHVCFSQAKEMEGKMERITNEQRDTHERLQEALKKREKDLAVARQNVMSMEEQCKNIEQTMSLSIQEATTVAVTECEERLGGEIALLNRKLTSEDNKLTKSTGLVVTLTEQLKTIETTVANQYKLEVEKLTKNVAQQHEDTKVMKEKHVLQKKQLVERVSLVDKR